jgi:hypothetical protein
MLSTISTTSMSSPAPPVVLDENESEEEEEEEPEEIEGESGLDSEHGDPAPNPQFNYSSSGRVSSVVNLDDF